MKFRWLAIVLGLAAFSTAPWTFSQTQNPSQNPTQTQTPTTDPDQGQPKAADVQDALREALRRVGLRAQRLLGARHGIGIG